MLAIYNAEWDSLACKLCKCKVTTIMCNYRPCPTFIVLFFLCVFMLILVYIYRPLCKIQTATSVPLIVKIALQRHPWAIVSINSKRFTKRAYTE